jgi:hypothetical protein
MTGVPKKERVYADKIDYEPNISYKKNLQHIVHTKCLLEIMQPGGVGFTQRGCETVCMNKFLITNNTKIKTQPFYNEKFILQIENASDITEEFIQSIKNGDDVDYQYKEKMSPVCFLQFIDDLLP